MPNKRTSKTHRKTQNRGRAFSFVVHLLLLLLAFLPFLAFQAPQEAPKEAILIQFDYPFNEYVAPQVEKFQEETPPEEFTTGETSKMSGSEAGGSPMDEPAAQNRPRQAAPSQLSNQSMNAVSRTTPLSSSLSSKMGEMNIPKPKVQQRQAWQSVNDVGSYEVDGVEEMQIVEWSSGGSFGDIPGEGPGGDGDDDSDIWSDGFGSGTGGTGGNGGGPGSATGPGSGPGGGTGAGNAGNKTGVGQNGTGMEWGLGLEKGFNRKMIRRGNIGSLASHEGKITMQICVDRSGIVVSTKYDVVNSTLKDPSFVARAEQEAKEYIFAPDASAPEKQCTKLAFIFKIK